MHVLEKVWLVSYIYFRAYIQLRFKHAVMGTQISFLSCLSRTDINVSRIEKTRYLFHKQQWIFYMHFPIDKIAHTMAFVEPVMEPLVGASGNTYPLSLAEHSLWVGVGTEVKNPMPRLRDSILVPTSR